MSHDSALRSLCSLLQRSSEPALYPMTNKIIADLEQGVRNWIKPNPGSTPGRIMRLLRFNGIPSLFRH